VAHLDGIGGTPVAHRCSRPTSLITSNKASVFFLGHAHVSALHRHIIIKNKQVTVGIKRTGLPGIVKYTCFL
jgi:hypothetical protein